jgi:Kef-type K+ transport system membrane component KefB
MSPEFDRPAGLAADSVSHGGAQRGAHALFVVGYELDVRLIRGRPLAAPLVAVGSLLVPMGMGSGAALIFRSRFAALGQSHMSHSFVLYLGVALAVTALPVLVAIVRERGMAGTTAAVTATTARACPGR